ncbi:hypothetical protein BDW62DRAFT_198647 [Aspergillus aurantiobrunneus]
MAHHLEQSSYSERNLLIFHDNDTIPGGEFPLWLTRRIITEIQTMVSHDLLRWHLRMSLLRMMKGNFGTQIWEHDMGPDHIDHLLAEPDAAERMEAELFTRLGAFVA